VWFGFIALTVCARLIGSFPISRRIECRWRAATLAIALAGTAVCARFGNAGSALFYSAGSNNFSPALVAELNDPAIAGNVMNSYELGGEVIYRYWPRLKPSIDSRVDSYSGDYLLFSIRLLRDEQLLNIFLDANRVNYMLLLRRDFEWKLRAMPSIRANWRIRLTDGDIFFLERNVALPPIPGRP